MLVDAFNPEKAIEGSFSVIVKSSGTFVWSCGPHSVPACFCRGWRRGDRHPSELTTARQQGKWKCEVLPITGHDTFIPCIKGAFSEYWCQHWITLILQHEIVSGYSNGEPDSILDLIPDLASGPALHRWRSWAQWCDCCEDQWIIVWLLWLSALGAVITVTIVCDGMENEKITVVTRASNEGSQRFTITDSHIRND